MEYLRIVQDFKQNKLNNFDTRLMDLFLCANKFNLGKLSTIYPEHYKASEILNLENKGLE